MFQKLPSTVARAAIAALLLTTIGTISCTRGGSPRGSGEIDQAIRSYIAGDYQEAVDRLERLSTEIESEEELREIYLYLGRSYIALGQPSKAIDAFSAGAAFGGGEVFDEYLARLGVVVSVAPELLAASDTVTREQLAALVDKLFFGGVEDIGAPSPGRAEDAASGVMVSVRRGLVPALPDGGFHGEEFVTRAAFYVVVARIIHDFDLQGGPSDYVAGGYRWVLEGDATGGGGYVTGREALATLEGLAEARNANG